MNIKHKVMVSLMSLALVAPIAIDSNLATETYAAQTSIPKRYQGTWHYRIRMQDKTYHVMKYVITKHRAYFSEYYTHDKSSKTKPITYKITGKNKWGYYETTPIGSYQGTPFKPSGKKLLVQYDTSILKFHR